MPSVIPNQNDYYARHHRRQSSMSQSSLPDQLKNSIAAAYSPSRSAIFLPATTYGQASPSRSQSPALANAGHIATHVLSTATGDVLSSAADPDDYYRQYSLQHAQSGADVVMGYGNVMEEQPKRQFTITSSAAPAEGASGPEDGNHDMSRRPGAPTSRTRRSSVKHLVAQINASSTEDPPPLPKNTISQPVSRSISPVLMYASQLQSLPGTAASSSSAAGVAKYHPHDHGTLPSSRRGLGLSVHDKTADASADHQRPLFGEVLQDHASLSGPGFGIQQFRQRSGSEGSPLLVDRSQFARTNAASRDRQNDPGLYSAYPHEDTDAAHDAFHVAMHSGSDHRRVNSDGPVTPTESFSHADFSMTTPSARNRMTTPNGHVPRTAQGRNTPAHSAAPGASTKETVRLGFIPQPTTPKRTHSIRRQRSPQIQSPGRRNRSSVNTTPSSHSSLQANIIVPPPKISPPLRSSRPRLPVSSASTAASRARMVEKFNTMQKLNSDKRATNKKPARPPELSDIDLKARRLRITQALSRSLEGQDLKGIPTSRQRTASPAYSDRSRPGDLGQSFDEVPMVMVDVPPPQLVTDGRPQQQQQQQPEERHAYTHNALNVVHGLKHVMNDRDDDDDSPTLGRGEQSMSGGPSPLQTDFLHVQLEDEPMSALTNVTVETEGTHFDPEPQPSFYQPQPGQSVLDRTNRMEHLNLQRSQQPESTYGDLSDREDKESVHLILRDTTYLDDAEAIRTGYRTALDQHPPVPQLPAQTFHHDRDSWTSSLADSHPREDHEISMLDSSSAAASDDGEAIEWDETLPRPGGGDDSQRSTMADDAYTIVNVVLQQHSTNGIVDQQFVDDVYQRILRSSSDDGEAFDTNKIEQICLRELQNREVNWRKSIIGARVPIQIPDDPVPTQSHTQDPTIDREAQPRYRDRATASLSPTMLKSHRYKSSLDSVEDWADTSPSVGDWMRFAVADPARKSMQREGTSQLRHQMNDSDTTLTDNLHQTTADALGRKEAQVETPEMYAGSALRTMSPGPPAPPAKDTPMLAQKDFGPVIAASRVPQRLASRGQLGQPNGAVQQEPSAPDIPPVDDVEGPEQRMLKKRRHIIKELVDTEYSYEKDLKVLCHIYKQTAPAALTDDDVRILFGNVEQIQDFSQFFLTSLKAAAKPSYIMERPERKKDKSFDEPSLRPNSSSSTLASSRAADNEPPSTDKDRETRLGQSFELAFARMEKVYADYIRNRHAANQRLEVIQKSTAAREWLKECRDNSSDITNAWNLDALLVKPVQRITKYPLLLRELVDSTPADHPDAASLKRAASEITEINIRINDVKKHTELVDQVLNRKRKESDVRIGLSKAFGRRAEKLKQHLGTAEMFEDHEYNDIKINYDNNIVQLMVVGNDCSSYGRAITQWVLKVVEIAAAGEAWIDVGPSNHQEAESKLRRFAMVTRGIGTIALPDHLEQLEAKVLNPMQSGVDLMNRFKNDQKGLLQKRDKRLIDYAQAKNKKDKGEKVDKKMAERMEQWEALNSEAKQRMTKLIRATAVLVQHCQRNLLDMQMSWLKMVQTKLATAIGVELEKLEREDIVKEWQLDFDFQEASALSLSICNGALIAEAVNMANLQTPSTTLNGDDSPRQPSFNGTQRRSMSLHSDGSHVNLADTLGRPNGQTSRHALDVPNERTYQHRSSFSTHQDRTTSAAASAAASANSQIRTSDQSARSGTHRFSSANSGYTGPSSVRVDDRSLTGAPRLSVDTPSPLIGSLQPESNHRPQSSSTFVTANAEIRQSTRHQSSGSNVFSSAMPMPDSPTVDRNAERMPEILREPEVLFTAASVYEFNIDRSRREAGFPYLTYVTGEIFDVIGYNGELWLAKNQDDPNSQVGWIWNKHFAKLAE